MSKRTGLPPTVRMRHDYHYVESITALTGAAIGKMIPIDRLRPNPNQPRKDLGDLRDLTHSIREKGVLEPLLVRHDADDDMYTIITGERRFRAARSAGLSEVPCIERVADGAEMMELALIENLQRKDLHPLEEAEGLFALAEQFDYTHEEIARRIGKSRATVTETLALRAIPMQVRKKCDQLGLISKSLLLQVARQPNERKMTDLAEKLASGMSRSEARAQRKPSNVTRLKPFVYTYRAPDNNFELRLRFRKSVVPRREILETLRAILDALEQQS
ncbi:MAG: ParB/RepB/Spo0J family partition protein [Acidobacteria bacterium]|nr:ParB/RepB/Spo0J family partition protein [Acidobacteriota bacterium]MCH7985112.1 ParB/RepB/Spo0J family partition protein [Acidobacteriota bacterium]MCH8947252.1 ParB/RepB/Spo0J family partition protein [Acidobacteriota bacterium]